MSLERDGILRHGRYLENTAARECVLWFGHHYLYMYIIIQQIVALSKYGHDALDICRP